MDNKFKFTPGPWESFNDDSDHQPVCFVGESNIDNKGYEVGQRHTQMHEGDAMYDSKLISAAPEMLEALIESDKMIQEIIDYIHEKLFIAMDVTKLRKWMEKSYKHQKLIEKATGMKWDDIISK